MSCRTLQEGDQVDVKEYASELEHHSQSPHIHSRQEHPMDPTLQQHYTVKLITFCNITLNKNQN